jgi:hypothetical protein
MSKAEKMVEEISAWKNKHETEKIDTKALDASMQSLVESAQLIVGLREQLKTAERMHKDSKKTLAETFVATRMARKELRRAAEIADKKMKAQVNAEDSAETPAEPTTSPDAAKARTGKPKN